MTQMMSPLVWRAVIAVQLCVLEHAFSQTLYNSTLACTRGADQTYMSIDCRNVYPDGVTRVLTIFRVFFGATPTASGCSRTAPYTNCCTRDPSSLGCTFPVDAELQDIVARCSGTSYCSFPGKRLATSLGNCDQNLYPNTTSFSFVEYNCTGQLAKPSSTALTSTVSTSVTTMSSSTVLSSSTPGATFAPPSDIISFNSSLACTRGAVQTTHNLDCRNHYQEGSDRSLSIIRVFYGTTPFSSGCDRTAPYANCCVRDPNKVDCVFQNDAELQRIIEKCSGNSYCEFPGLRVSSSVGNCDPNNYPALTSFSFIEYQCLPRQVTSQVCSDINDRQIGRLFLESNSVLVGKTVTNTMCQCLITTDCDSSLSFYGIVVQLTQINATICAEEIAFADIRYPQLFARVNCTDDDTVLYNKSLFTSLSNEASFQFRVTGQQLGKIYIRAQSSINTANVTLICGTSVAQAVSQIQQCPNQTTTKPLTTTTTGSTSTVRVPVEGATFNSSLACTRGSDQTNHNLDCRNHYQDGDNRSLSIVRVFYGATPLSSGCDRTAPYANCCVRDPNKVDCVFQNDVELQGIIEKCSGNSYCEFPGLRVSSSVGNCDPNNYPALTSFSFIEYQCLPRQVTIQVCSDINDRQIGRLYLESNAVLVGKTVTNTMCQCLITTDCDSSLSFYGIVVQLTQINATTCTEEIAFADIRYPQLSARVNCTDDDTVLYNKSLFTSLSNVASFQFRVTGQQLGKIYIRAQSSVNTANVTLICGTSVAQAVSQIQQCPNQTTTTPLTTTTTGSTSTVRVPVEGAAFNSSLACTRGSDQTNHNLDCRNHYQDGDNRSLSIVRVFYGATPLSSGCDRTAPYANCCVRDPNKVDCVFQNDVELQGIIEKCSGNSYCEFPGLRVTSSVGNCDPNNYPALTSFSFIEYQCLPRQVTIQVCSDINDRQIGRLYLESNAVLVGKTVTNTMCQCLITADCDSSLSFYGIVVQLTQINATTCTEEIAFADIRYPQLSARVNCTDDDTVLYNKSLFTSLSNVASFQFRVTGKQLGKIYIRAQSSINTANVTLICGTSVAQAVRQIQQCPYQTTTTPLTTTTTGSTSTVRVPVEGAAFNSSLACTRGSDQTNHNLDCRNHYQDGDNRSLSIVRVFYGATPLSSGCDRTAPYANCCVRDPNKVDCVFQNDVELQGIIEKCSGNSYCEFPGLRVSSSVGNCDPNNYPALTSFSFIEYQCLPRQVTIQVCSDINDRQIGRLYLESNAVLVGKTVTNTMCQCLITADCDSSLSFYGIVVQLTQINATTCTEEIAFADIRYPQLSARVNCTDDDTVLYNKSLFTSLSNVASFQFRVTGQQLGKIYIRAQSSINTANVTLICGSSVAQAVSQIQQCPNQTTTTPLTTTTTGSTSTVRVPVEGAAFNSSLACTRGSDQTNHNLDCRNHYQDGDNRSLSIIRVFYGATPLSSGCDRTAPYANCCVRDPNKVDCVFQNDVELQGIIEKCSGNSYCEFPGLRVSSSVGNCDPNNYPALTSFSFIEYQCLPRQVTIQVCSDINDRQIGRLYLESNAVLVGKTVTNTMCQCLITADCDSSLSFYGIVVQLTQINATTCTEEIAFADIRYPQLSARVNCTDDDTVLYNKSLFTSLSNVASFQFRVTGQQLGKIYIRAQSSINTANVTLICGTPVAQAVTHIQQCPKQTFPSSATTLQYNITTTPSKKTTTAVQYYQSTSSSSPNTTTALLYNQTTTSSSPDTTAALQYNQPTTSSSPDSTAALQYNQSTTLSSPNTTAALQYNKSTTLSSPNTTSSLQYNQTTTSNSPNTSTLLLSSQTVTLSRNTTTSLQYNETTTTSSPTTLPNRTVSSATSATTTTWYSMTSSTSTTTRALEEAAFNSTLSCTRGADLTNHNLDCRKHYQDGDNRSLTIIRVFYGATPLSSGCDRTAPYANCCVRDPNKVDCVFQNDVELQGIIEKCSGNSYCEFPGLRVSSSLGNCDPNNYPALTSFSFIEFQCLPRQVTGQTVSISTTSTVAIDATSASPTLTSQTTGTAAYGSSSQLGGVRLFDVGTITGIVFGVLGATVILFIIILIFGRYNRCRTSSSDSDITIMPDGKIGTPHSRLWVKDKWSASL